VQFGSVGCSLEPWKMGGNKNRAIVKKMFEISPIVKDGIKCQLFKFMTFFVSRKDLTSTLGFF
jgi:hypothetical protein